MQKARITEQAAVLLVSDINISISYWRDQLGFKAVVYGEPPEFAIMRRDNASVMLSQKPADHEIVPYWKIKDKLWNAYFWIDDAKSMFEEFSKAGAKIDYGLCEQPYGILEFGIQDPDGHDIAFGQDIE
ncbi:MAG: VOC family protein [Rhizobiaceae bacterium]